MRTFIILLSALVSLSVASSAQVSGDLCTGGKASGTGLRGAYYNADPRISRPWMVRVDPRIESASVRNLPKQPAGARVQWVRWCGWIRPIMSGPHRFHSAANVLSVKIGKQAVTGPTAAAGGSIDLEAGKAYSILVELPNADGIGEFSLQWTPPFGASYDVPPTVLFPPIETVEPGC
jgi:hypothetical protein